MVGKTLYKDVCTALAILMETLNEIEENQIRGLVYIIDVAGVGLSFINILPIENWLNLAKNTEKCLAARHKGIHVVNLSPALQYVASFAVKHSNEKMRERIKFYSSFDELTIVNKSSLPKEVGGTIPLKELSGESPK